MGTVPRTEDLYSAPDPASELARQRDAVLRRWLGMEVERASVGELAERPLSERLQELEALFEAAVSELRGSARERAGELGAALERELERQRSTGAPFTVAVLAAPEPEGPGTRRWLSALSDAAEDGTRVFEVGAGLAAAIMSAVRRDEAAAAVPDEMVTQSALLGTEDMVRGRIRRYRDAGVTLPAVGPMPVAEGPEATLEAAAPKP
jgi:hypothetical protein